MEGNRKQRIGIVITDSMNKTITIKVVDLYRHPLLGKVVKRVKKFIEHDEKNEAKVGDNVMISETRPLSKRKCWRLVKILDKVAIKE